MPKKIYVNAWLAEDLMRSVMILEARLETAKEQLSMNPLININEIFEIFDKKCKGYISSIDF